MPIRPALLAVLLAVPLFASPDAPPMIPRAGETIEVSIVDFDVIVTDSHGNRVHGLTRDDFEVFEEKKPQAITNFAEYTAKSAEREKRTIVLFIEKYPDAKFRVEPTFQAVKAALHEIVGRGDSVTIATWDTSPVIALQGSDDLNAIDSTLDAIEHESIGLNLRTIRDFQRLEAITDELPRFAQRYPGYGFQSLQGDRLGFHLWSPYDIDGEEMRDQVAAINSLINMVGNEGGRKAFLLMSRSIGPATRTDYFYTVEKRGVPLWHDYYRNSQLVDTIKATAAARNVPIYVFPLGPPLEVVGGDPAFRVGPDPFINAQLDKIAALNDIAKTTGGTYATGTDIARVLPRVRDDLNDYYSLAYRVPSRNDNHVRSVVVKTKNPEYKVRTRKQYIEKNDDVRVRDEVIASLIREPGPSGISVDAHVGQPVKKGRNRTSVPVTVSMPASSFMTSGAKGAFSVYIATGRDAGKPSDITKKTVAFTADDLAKAAKGKVEFDFELVTERDANLLSVAVYDELSHDSGYTRVDLPRMNR